MKVEALKKKIQDRGIRHEHIAKQLDLSAYGFSLKINGTNEFKWSEIEKIAQVLNLSKEEREEIFFTK